MNCWQRMCRDVATHSARRYVQDLCCFINVRSLAIGRPRLAAGLEVREVMRRLPPAPLLQRQLRGRAATPDGRGR
jgi:hypothetical protein